MLHTPTDVCMCARQLVIMEAADCRQVLRPGYRHGKYHCIVGVVEHKASESKRLGRVHLKGSVWSAQRPSQLLLVGAALLQSLRP
jgi:hypothetical protein